MDCMVEGEPRGKGRPRFMRNGHTYTDSKTKAYEKLIREEFRKQCPGVYFEKGVRVSLYIRCYFKVPKSARKKDKELMKAGIMPCFKKPDVDNVAKIIMDALNGTAYYDDCQIAPIFVDKKWDDGKGPRVEISISERKQ